MAKCLLFTFLVVDNLCHQISFTLVLWVLLTASRLWPIPVSLTLIALHKDVREHTGGTGSSGQLGNPGFPLGLLGRTSI